MALTTNQGIQPGATVYGNRPQAQAPQPQPDQGHDTTAPAPTPPGTYSHFARGVHRTAQVANAIEGGALGMIVTGPLAVAATATVGALAPLLLVGGAAVLGAYAAVKLGNWVGDKLAARAEARGQDGETARAVGQAGVTAGLAACTGGVGAVFGWGVVEAAGGLINKFRHHAQAPPPPPLPQPN